MLTSKEIRQTFLDFFQSKEHFIETSAPIVLKNDPTLMFTNAGMNQFKDLFLGHGKIVHKRVADTQKCLRVSGKHNDLEEVGVDTYHHTMFEMLGNWSFGDYFKKDAIAWAWELLTEVFKIDKESLYVTVFEGDAKEGLAFDQEAYDFWKEHIAQDRILKGNKKDNFWEMGDQGPCGPCSEIHIDLRSAEEKAKVPGKELVNNDHPQVVEVWNLVFMQFNRKADGSLEPLPAQHVDTGMGFERLCMALQGKRSNYDTDVFTPLIERIVEITGVKYNHSHERTDVAIRVISDHIRAVSFAIADGQLPSNSGAGYVIRRILRRAVRYGYSFLDQRQPFFYKLVKVLSDQMGESFPEIRSQQKLIESVIREEEQSFLRTLEQGLVRLEQIVKETSGKVVDGRKVFELYDTYGFPLDLTALVLREKGYDLDEKGFEEQMQAQKERARAAAAVQTDDWQGVNPDDTKNFIGYDTLEADVKISKYRRVKTNKKEFYHLIFPITPFYAESGGQAGDRGYIVDASGDKTPIIDTIKENDLTVHIAEALPKNPSAIFHAVVDQRARTATAANHSATHLLDFALRQVLGKHVEQKGSAVGSEGLRFDFSHFSKMTPQQIEEVENLVNDQIKAGYALDENRACPYKDAMAQGAIALFSEKYGDKVRTIRFGDSFELCGGTHVDNTLRIRLFRILSESAIAAGVRRIEAITGDKAIEYYKLREREMEYVRDLLKGNNDIQKALMGVLNENADLKKGAEEFMKEKARVIKEQIKKTMQNKGGIHFASMKLLVPAEVIKNIAFELAGEVENLFLVIGSTESDQKATLTVMISKDLAKDKGLNAGAIVREASKEINGGGGGAEHFATAGGKNPAGLDAAIDKAMSFLQAVL